MVVLAGALALAVPAVNVAVHSGGVRTVAVEPGGSIWRLAVDTRERAGASASAWFFVDRRDGRGERLGTSRVRYRFNCQGRRAQRLERVDLAVNGRVVGRLGAHAEGPAGRGTLAGKLLEAACG